MLRRLLMAMAGALIAAFAIAAPAWALEATVAPSGAIETASEGVISFRGGPFTITCPLTLRGSVRAGPIEIRAPNQFGAITGVTIGRCSGGTVERVLFTEAGRTWPLRFEVLLFTRREEREVARKENLTGFLYRVERSAFQLAVFGEAVRCLYQGDSGALAEITNRGEDRRGGWLYSFNRSRALEEIRLAKVSGGELCPATGSFAGSFRAPTPAQTVTVR